jgi:SAM-dependent methyltransferase
MWRLNTELSALGERHQLDWLIYNPIQMHLYHLHAQNAAPAALSAMTEVLPEPQRYVDVGAGSGAFAAEARRRGKSVQACERSRVGQIYARLQGVESVPFDLEKEPPARLDGPFDLAFCFEVAEHLPPALSERLVPFICGLAPIAVFSAAQPGQGGLAHINERPPDYWRSQFAAQGWQYEDSLTEAFRASARRQPDAPDWLLLNVLVFSEA